MPLPPPFAAFPAVSDLLALTLCPAATRSACSACLPVVCVLTPTMVLLTEHGSRARAVGRPGDVGVALGHGEFIETQDVGAAIAESIELR